jgi:hypothetical protein
MISWWSKHVGVILSVLMCDIWINVLLHTSALVGPLHIITKLFTANVSVADLRVMLPSLIRYLTFRPHGATAPSGVGPPHCRGFMITLSHHTLGEWSAPSQRPLPDNTQHSQRTSMQQAGFEPTITASERPRVFVYSFSGNTTAVAVTVVTSATESLRLRPLTVHSNMPLRSRW